MDTESIRRRHEVRVAGDGDETFVLVHGLASDQRAWSAVVERLAPHARVVTFDLAGAGRSDPAAWDPARHGRLEGYAEDLLAVLEAFGGPRPVVVGHSVGGALALLASLAAPSRVARAVLLAPSPRYLDDPPDYHGGFRPEDVAALLELMELNFMGWAESFAGFAAPQPEVAARMRADFAAGDPRRVRAFAALTLNVDLRARLPEVAMPVLVAQCAHDAVVPVPVGEAMARALPRGSYRLLDVGGHFPHVSHPALVAEVVRDFAGAP